jgi:Ni/Co efflux regulator RcnB
MKRILLTTVAALALITTGFTAQASAQTPQGRAGQYQGPSERAHQQDERRESTQGPQQDDRREGARDPRDSRENWRDDGGQWNEARHNGYYVGDRWTYGPPSALMVRRGAVPGYQPWRAGRSLGYYQTRFTDVDYRAQHLRPPPRGHRWVRDDRGDYLLIANRGGRVLEVVISGRDHRDRRQAWRDDRADARWDDTRYNGYYSNNRWTYGPPPNNLPRGSVVYGYQPWERGQRLGYYQGRYAEVDYRSQRGLRVPPQGYHWVRNDGGDFLLAAVASGLIAQVIINSGR